MSLASEDSKYYLTGFFKAMQITLYRKLFKLYPFCFDDMTHTFTKNYVHKYPYSFAYENATTTIVCGHLHYSLTMKELFSSLS